MLAHSLRTASRLPEVDTIVVVTREEDRAAVEALWRDHGEATKTLRWAPGGATRSASVGQGLAALEHDEVLVHDAARPLASAALYRRVIEAVRRSGAAVPGMPVVDTLKRPGADGRLETVSREGLHAIQTPQGFDVALLRRAHAAGDLSCTDDAVLVEALGHRVELVEGEVQNIKVTHPADLTTAEAFLASPGERESVIMPPRIGLGADLHRLEAGGPLRLAAVDIPADVHSVGHSDGDAVLHAITDAVLGLCAAGDIGAHFSDQDALHAGRDSGEMLLHAVAIARGRGLRIAQVDCVVWLERPRLAPHRDAMRGAIAVLLDLPVEDVSVKAKTHEGVDAIGRSEAVRCDCVVTAIPGIARDA
jgi:2-C-methyl-D-erythritol 4-phosphate cytidylyltransferase/2-C-methyl-D-erythritol 2,4-cyclodiphosphate synthase